MPLDSFRTDIQVAIDGLETTAEQREQIIRTVRNALGRAVWEYCECGERLVFSPDDRYEIVVSDSCEGEVVVSISPLLLDVEADKVRARLAEITWLSVVSY